MTTFPNEKVQHIIQETFPNFLEHWVDKYPTFEEAWNLCRSGATMVGILLEYAPDSVDLHWVGLRSAKRALGILTQVNQKPEFQRSLDIKEIWLRGKLSDSVLEYNRNIVTPLVLEADEAAKVSMGDDGSLNPIFGLDMFIARSVLNSNHSDPFSAVLATTSAASAFCITNRQHFNDELLRQANDVREFFPATFFSPPVVRKSRYEREWVI